MNEQASTRVTESQPEDYPPGTVLPVEGDETEFYVLGSRGWWYFVTTGSESQPPSCECEDHTFRRRECLHIVKARAFRDLGGADGVQEEVDGWKELSEAERRAVFA